MSADPSASSRSPWPWRKILQNVALVVLSLLVAEGGLQVYAWKWCDYRDDSYVYVPYVEHVVPIKHPGTPDGFRPTFGQDRVGPRIWCLGGSTMFGGYTGQEASKCEPESPCSIPSQLNSVLSERGLRGAAWNLGQPAFNSSQERILFQEMLFRNERPKIAIFYDGVNELGRVMVVGYPDEYHQLHDAVTKRLARINVRKDLGKSSLKIPYLLDFLANSEDFWPNDGENEVQDFNPFKLTRNLHVGRRAVENPDGVDRAAEHAADFGKEVAERYLYNLKLTQSVCDAFEIACLFLWQPTVCTKAHRSEREQSNFDTLCAEWYLDSQRVALRMIKEDPWIQERGTFHDLSGVLDAVEDEVYHDWCHIDMATPGHRIIAEAILDLIAAEDLL